MKTRMLKVAACLAWAPAWMWAAQQPSTTTTQSQTTTDQSQSTYGQQSTQPDRSQMRQRMQKMMTQCQAAQDALDQAARLMGVSTSGVTTSSNSSAYGSSASAQSSTSPSAGSSSSSYPSSSSRTSSSAQTTPRTDESTATMNPGQARSYIAQAEKHMRACTSTMSEMRSMHQQGMYGSQSGSQYPGGSTRHNQHQPPDKQ